jgi:HAE1 family hydrophobic/amphiphilic exporter-1
MTIGANGKMDEVTFYDLVDETAPVLSRVQE